MLIHIFEYIKKIMRHSNTIANALQQYWYESNCLKTI